MSSHNILQSIPCLGPSDRGGQCGRSCIHDQGSISSRRNFRFCLSGRIRVHVSLERYLKPSIAEPHQYPRANLPVMVLQATLLDTRIGVKHLNSSQTRLFLIGVQVKHCQTISCF